MMKSIIELESLSLTGLRAELTRVKEYFEMVEALEDYKSKEAVFYGLSTEEKNESNA